jgi:hypothetical protein
MWQTKYFKNLEAMNTWIEKNEHRYQITRLFVNNGYALEYKKMRIIDLG